MISGQPSESNMFTSSIPLSISFLNFRKVNSRQPPSLTSKGLSSRLILDRPDFLAQRLQWARSCFKVHVILIFFYRFFLDKKRLEKKNHSNFQSGRKHFQTWILRSKKCSFEEKIGLGPTPCRGRSSWRTFVFTKVAKRVEVRGESVTSVCHSANSRNYRTRFCDPPMFPFPSCFLDWNFLRPFWDLPRLRDLSAQLLSRQDKGMSEYSFGWDKFEVTS